MWPLWRRIAPQDPHGSSRGRLPRATAPEAGRPADQSPEEESEALRSQTQIRAYQRWYYELCIRVDREGMRQKWRESKQRRNMRLIHVTYRATFKRLKDTLFKYAGEIKLQVIQLANGRWG